MQIEKVTLRDLPQLKSLAATTYQQTFEDIVPEHDLKNYIDQSFEIKELESEFFNPNS